MDTQFLSPIRSIARLLAKKIRGLPFWWSYILIALVFIGITALYIWFYGLRQRVEAKTIASLEVYPRVDNLWFLPNGTLFASQQSGSMIIVSTWKPDDSLNGRTSKRFDVENLIAQIESRMQENRSSERAASSLKRQDLPEATAIAHDGSRIAHLAFGYVCVSDDVRSQVIDTLDESAPDGDPVLAVAFTDAGLLALAHTGGRIEFRNPADLLNSATGSQTKLKRPSLLKPSGNFMVVVSTDDGAAVVLDMNSLFTEAPPHGYPLSVAGQFALAVSKERRLAIGTGGSKVYVTPHAGEGGASIALDAYGPVKTLSFYDEDRVLVGGSFEDVYLLSQGEIPARIATAPAGVNALAVSADKIAYAGDDRIFLVSHNTKRQLDTSGKVATGVCAAILLGLSGLFLYDLRKRRELPQEIEKPVDPDARRLPAELPPDLIEVCAAGECVLYAGAGLSAQAGLPIWKDFVHGLLKWALDNKFIEQAEADSFSAEIETGDSDPVADSIISRLTNRDQLSLLNNYLRKVFQKSGSPSAAHLLLRRIKFSAVLTTNFDNLLERTYQDLPEKIDIYTPNDAERLLTALTKRDYFILKLYGRLEEPETVMVAPAQYESAITGNRVFSQFMQTLFFSRTLLFIGASLEGIDAYLRGISLPRETARKHYALVAVTGNAWRAKADLLERRFGIKVLAYTPGSDYAELIGFLRKLSARAAREPVVGTELKQATSRLKRISLENIGPFNRLTLEVDSQLQILLGDNGVGKSTVLKAIALALCGEDAQPYADRLLSSGASRGKVILETDNKTSYVTEIDRNFQTGETEITSNTARPLEAEGWLAIGFPPLRTTSWTAPKGPDAEIKTNSRPVADDVLPLIKGDVDPRLDKLKQWIVNLDYLSIKNDSTFKSGDDRYRKLVNKVFGVIATVTEGMTLKFVGVENRTNKVLIQTDDGINMPLEALSQGTISLIGWLGILLQRLYEVFDQDEDPTKRYALVLMDEIDAHMHPLWQRTLVNHLKEIFPNVQFIATTHSPLLIRGMPPQQVIRFARDAHGKVTMPPLERDMTLGYTDQVLTSMLFGLTSELDDTTERKKKRYYELFEMKDRSDYQDEYELLKQELMIRIPPRTDTYQEKHDEQLLEVRRMKELGEKLKQVSPEGGQVLMDRAESLRSGIEGGIKNDPN